MASIQCFGDKWRAQIYIGGMRESSVFDEKFQAETWAKDREVTLKAINRKIVASHTMKKDRKVFVDSTEIHSDEEIIESSMSAPDTSGVYFLIRGGAIVYVGQSRNVYARIEAHKQSKEFDRITVLECEERNLRSLESLYIKKFQPPLNILGIGRITEVDLIGSALAASQ